MNDGTSIDASAYSAGACNAIDLLEHDIIQFIDNTLSFQMCAQFTD